MRLSLFVPVVLLALGVQTAAAQLPPPPPPPPSAGQPPRDPRRQPPPDPTGTAVIRGRVVASDTGSPVRKATVNLSAVMPVMTQTATGTPAGTPPTGSQVVTVNGNQVTVTPSMVGSTIRPRTTVTDAQGMFEFKELPAGTYRLSANPGQYSAQYLNTTYGAKRPNAPGSMDPGQPIPLTDGQTFTATVALQRGSVITGRVADENGDPLARVQVFTLYFPPGSTRGQRNSSATTDDLGNFRLYGLAPGEYAIVAEARNNMFTPPNAGPETEEERAGMLTTYYPGTADENSAQRVRTRSGETGGIEIRMVPGRMLHISGLIVPTEARTDTRFTAMLMPRSGPNNGMNTYGVSVDPQGKFQMRNVPPGEYKLIARQMSNRPPIPGPNQAPDPGESAIVPISLTTDIDDLLITTTPGATITGQIVYENGAPPLLPNGQTPPPPRVNVQLPDPQNFGGLPMPPGVQAAQDLTFTLKGLMGEYLIRANGAGSQYVKSVQIGGEDITDTPREFKQGDKITIVMTTKASTIVGAVTDDKGEPVNGGTLLLFSEDKSTWRTNSIHTHRGGVDITGHFRMMGVLPGRYLLIAIPQERASALNFGAVDPAIFEQFAKEATSVTVAEDEQRQVDLKISPGPGGQ